MVNVLGIFGRAETLEPPDVRIVVERVESAVEIDREPLQDGPLSNPKPHFNFGGGARLIVMMGRGSGLRPP